MKTAELIINRTYTTLGCKVVEPIDGELYTKVVRDDPELCFQVVPVMNLPYHKAIFTALVPGLKCNVIYATYTIPATDPEHIWLSNPQYFSSLLDALDFLGMVPEQIHTATLYYHCQACSNDWKITIPLLELHDITLTHDAKICGECGEPVNSGIYKIVIDDDFDLPLYHGPLF